MTSSTTSNSFQCMAPDGYPQLIHKLFSFVMHSYPKDRFLRSCIITVQIASKVNGVWLTSSFRTSWESPNISYFDIHEKDPKAYDRQLFEKTKSTAKSNGTALAAIKSQRFESAAVQDFLSKLKLAIEAENNRDWRTFIAKKTNAWIEDLLKEIHVEATVFKVTAGYVFSPLATPEKKFRTESTLSPNIKCGACDAWQSTANKLVHCIPCISQHIKAYFCNSDCAKRDFNHKCTQVKTEGASYEADFAK